MKCTSMVQNQWFNNFNAFVLFDELLSLARRCIQIQNI